MTGEEMTQRLNNFGLSHKLMTSTASAGPANLLQQIGRYGVGFLSALAFGESVEVTSRTRSSNRLAVWKYDAGMTSFKVGGRTVSVDDPHGTRVTVKLSADANAFLRRAQLTAVAKKYAVILRPRVTVNEECVNPKRHLWNYPERVTLDDWKSFLLQELGVQARYVHPICQKASTGDSISVGVLFVPQRKRFIFRQEESTKVFVHRMYLDSSQLAGNLLPDWAKFVGLVIDSDYLERQVSGEGFIQNQQYSSVTTVLAAEVIKMLRTLSVDEQEYFAVLGEYDDELKTACVESPELMHNLGGLVRVTVVGGERLTIKEYRDRLSRRLRADAAMRPTVSTGSDIRPTSEDSVAPSEEVMFAFEQPGEEATAQVLSQGTHVPIINAVYGMTRVMLTKYGSTMKVRVSGLEELARQHFKGRPELVDSFKRVLESLSSIGVEGRIRSFKPTHVPAILTFGRESETERASFKDILLAAVKHGAVSAELAEEWLHDSRPERKTRRIQLYLNADNSTMAALANTEIPDDDLDLIMRALYNSAYMFNFRSLEDSETDAVFQTTTAVIDRLVMKANPRTPSSESGIRKQRRAVMVVDLQGSTPLHSLIGPDHLATYLSVFSRILREHTTRRGGSFVSFTGDGCISSFDDEKLESARRCAMAMREVLDEVIDNVPEELRTDLLAYKSSSPGIRVVVTYGTVFSGGFGAVESIVGPAIVEASRIADDKQLFRPQFDALITADFKSAGRMSDAQCESVKPEFEVRGSGRKLALYRLL
jgi:class 3 adenylate cyclase